MSSELLRLTHADGRPMYVDLYCIEVIKESESPLLDTNSVIQVAGRNWFCKETVQEIVDAMGMINVIEVYAA